MNSTTAPFFSANDLARMLFGILIVAAGVLSILVYLGRIKRKDYSLLYFGAGSLLYGVRLFISGSASYVHHHWDVADPAISLVIVIPFFLFLIELSPHWKKYSSLVVGIFVAIALFGFFDLAWLHNLTLVHATTSITALVAICVFLVMLFIPFRSAGREQSILRTGLVVFMLFAIYTNLVNMRAIGGSPDVEYIGFVFFLGCLGYVAVRRTQRNEERLLALNKEMEIARDIQAGLLPEKSFVANGVSVTSRYIPASSVAGDFYDFLTKDSGGIGVLIADVSGHGVPAALSASMVKVAIRAQREWADDPAQVLTGLNSILSGNLQGQFVTAGYLFLHPKQGTLSYAGAGHPPLLVWRAHEKKIEAVEENGLILGIIPEGSYKSTSSAAGTGDRFVLYTDGILEAPNSAGEEFGMERLKNFLAENAILPAQQFCDALISTISNWCGKAASEHRDDLTLIVIDNLAA